MSEKLLQGEDAGNEDFLDTDIRPKYLRDFQGQSDLKENLAIFIKAAVQRNEALDHTFISGPPGLGKTTLANIISNEMASDFKITSAPALDKPKDLAGLLTTITERTVFFIDEIHRLKPAIEEMLYIAMEDYELDWIVGQGPAARTVRIPVPAFTLVGATTKPGRVSSPFFTRFGITMRIDYYNEKELLTIIQRSADILNVTIDRDAAALLSRCSRGTPRISNRLLRRMRDYAQVKNSGIVDKTTVVNGLKQLRIDREGLDALDRRILQVLVENFGGGPVGVETLAISVGEGVDSLEDFYEPYLIQKGFLQRTPRGRVATEKAYKHIGKKYEANQNQSFLF